MDTIALRFGEHFSPECGTIKAHQEMINKLGYVWYGKMGSPISEKAEKAIKTEKEPKILLIQSGKTGRFWAYVVEMQRKLPPLDEIPPYYRDKADKFSFWFKIVKFEEAPKNIMSFCRVKSSRTPLNLVSKHCLNPYFIIEVGEKEY